MKKIAVMLLMLVFLGGCFSSKWSHPNIADPKKEDEAFEVHSAQCRKEVDETYADTPENEEYRQDVYEKCLKALGWEEDTF
ncbi:hypothetical protein [Salidesulfovibrio onnuriiensis]|uniref:hypothetical protein n=1 Tax=Salidesulfovibrio onnuriiensis TaxID=2583823 RepID=UPI0011C7805C|nr:hypothetical protein [Salidesulfovibrio onnuriiensis]